MNNHEKKMRASQMALMAQDQSIAGKVMRIGSGMEPGTLQAEPFRIIENAPIYYCGANEIYFGYDHEKRKFHKWGEFYHPYMMPGMPDVGGINKIYVDTSIKGWYLLIIYSKLDKMSVGPSYFAGSIIAWTPKQKGDTITKAGYRMFWATAMSMDFVKEGEFYSEGYDDDGNWPDEWHCSSTCFHVLAGIRCTSYESQKNFDKVLSSAPEMLKPHIISRKKSD